jgi:hypothetical protein
VVGRYVAKFGHGLTDARRTRLPSRTLRT